LTRGAVRRGALSATGILLILATATGCSFLMEDSPPAQLSVKLQDGVLLVTNCGTSAVGEVRVSMGETVGDEFDNFFVGFLDDGWDAGETLSSTSDVWVRVERSESPVLEPRARLAIRFIADGGGRVARYTIPDRGVPEDAWLHPDGTITSAACGE